MRNGSSSSLCRDRSLCFSVFFFLSLLRLFFYFWTMMVVSGWLGGTVEAMVAAMRTAAGGSSSPLFLCWFRLFLFFHSPCTLKIPRFVPLFHTKNYPLFLSFSLPKNPPWLCRLLLSFSKILPPSLLVPPLVFISRGGEDYLTPVMVQGKVGDGSCWQGMVSVSFFFHNACRVWLCGYGSCGFFGQVGWRERGEE